MQMLPACLLAVAAIASAPAAAAAGEREGTPAPEPALVESTAPRVLFDVENHGPDAVLALLRRAEALAAAPPGDEGEGEGEAAADPDIVIVLHGPDLKLFDEAHYDDHKDVVDLAASLDARGIIDFKACRTTAQSLGIEPAGLPPFLEQVPFGPREIERLRRRGYTEL